MAVINIQGIDCVFRDKGDGEDILYSHLPKEDQFFRREEVPFSEEDIVDMNSVGFELRKAKYSKSQALWVEREEKRMSEDGGVYAYINGTLTFIPGSYWGYINYWTLEHGEKPDYREADRAFFLFMEYIGLHTDVLALTRGKGRRQGATSIGFYWMWWICGRNHNKTGGSISYNDTIAQNNFHKMFINGFRSLPICFLRDADNKSENFVKFRKKDENSKIGSIKKPEGLNSYVDFLPNSLNSYDGSRSSLLLLDESGKYDKNNINTYWSKVSPTLKTGRKKVGFAYMPTTVNPKKKGGENYRKFWNESDQNSVNPSTGEKYGLNTRHKVVRYFVPATEGYLGCIDKYGASVIDDPVEPVMGNDGDWITEGSKSIILKERSMKDGEQYMEHRRDFPLDEFDMFSFESGSCEFNEENIRVQLQYLEDNKGKYFLRQVRLYWEQILEIDPLRNINRYREIVKFADDPKGDWLLYEMPKNENNFKIVGGHFEPENILDYGIGVDTFKGGFSVNGSQGTICVGKKSSVEQGEEKGMYPVMFYVGRPRLVQHFYEEVRKACFWYGCKVNYEIDAGDYYYGYFEEKKSLRFLEWCPAVNPNKKHPLIKPGTESADPFQLAAELEAAKVYVDGTGIDHYNGHVHRIVFPHLLNQLLEYNHEERTPYDSVIACMMWLLITLKQTRPQQVAKYYKPLIKTFKLNL